MNNWQSSWRAFVAISLGIGLYMMAVTLNYPLLKIDSDTFYLPVLFKDVLNGSGHISDWYLSPAPYFFPDFLLFFLSQLWVDDAIGQMMMFGSLQVILLWWIGGYSLHKLDVPQPYWASALSVLALISVSVYNISIYSLLFVSVHHVGVLLIGMLVCGLWLDIVKSEVLSNRLVKIGLIFLLACLTNLSDQIFLAQFVGPILVMAMLIAVVDITQRMTWIILGGVLLTGAVIGSWSYSGLVTHATRYEVSISWELVAKNGPKLGSFLQEFYQAHTVLAISLLITNLAILGAIGFCWANKQVKQMFVLGMILLSFFMVCAGLLVSNISDFPARYFIPNLFLPVFFVFAALSWLQVIKNNHYYMVVAGILLLVISSAFYFRYAERATLYNSDLECLDKAIAENQLHYGIAQYWDAKLLQSILKNPIVLSQVNSSLGNFYWITSEKFYQPSYDFAIISRHAEPNYKLRADLIKRINGEPKKIVSCGQRDVLIYPTGQLFLEKFSAAGKVFVWEGYELPSQIFRHENTSGILTFGPRELLKPGLYKATIRYKSSAAATKKAGDWGVVLYRQGQAPTVLGQGVLVGTENALNEAVGQFQIKQSGLVDIPTVIQPNQTLTLETLTIERLE